MARADHLRSYHRDRRLSRRRRSRVRHKAGADSGAVLEARAERGERAGAMAAWVLRVGAELRERETGRLVDDDGIVAEPAVAARRERDRAVAAALDLDDGAVGPRERERAAKRRATVADRNVAHRFEELRDVHRVGSALAGIARGPDTRRAAERVDLEP